MRIKLSNPNRYPSSLLPSCQGILWSSVCPSGRRVVFPKSISHTFAFPLPSCTKSSELPTTWKADWDDVVKNTSLCPPDTYASKKTTSSGDLLTRGPSDFGAALLAHWQFACPICITKLISNISRHLGGKKEPVGRGEKSSLAAHLAADFNLSDSAKASNYFQRKTMTCD